MKLVGIWIQKWRERDRREWLLLVRLYRKYGAGRVARVYRSLTRSVRGTGGSRGPSGIFAHGPTKTLLLHWTAPLLRFDHLPNRLQHVTDAYGRADRRINAAHCCLRQYSLTPAFVKRCVWLFFAARWRHLVLPLGGVDMQLFHGFRDSQPVSPTSIRHLYIGQLDGCQRVIDAALTPCHQLSTQYELPSTHKVPRTPTPSPIIWVRGRPRDALFSRWKFHLKFYEI